MVVKVIGNITAVTDKVVLLRASGEQLLISPSTPIYPGDTIVTNDGSSVIIEFRDETTGTITGHGKIENGKIARFDDTLLLNITPLLNSSTEDDPVNLGIESTVSILELLAHQAPSAGTTPSTEESSR